MDFERFLTKANLNDGTLKNFFVRVSINGATQVCNLCTLNGNGLRITFFGNENFPPNSFLSSSTPEKLIVPKYNESDLKVKEALQFSAGGIILFYDPSSYEVQAHRLCQTRIGLKTAKKEYQIIQKCPVEKKMFGMTVFSYRDLFNRLLTNNGGWVETSATLFVGTDKVTITLQPAREYKIKKSIEDDKKRRRTPFEVDVDKSSSHSSLPNYLTCCLPMFAVSQQRENSQVHKGPSSFSNSAYVEDANEQTALLSSSQQVKRNDSQTQSTPLARSPLSREDSSTADPVQSQPRKRRSDNVNTNDKRATAMSKKMV